VKDAPTYHDLGDHTESIQIDFDPSVITYEELLDVFWQSHDATRSAWSRQYASLILFHTPEQERLARASAAAQEGKVATEIRPAGEFWRAEDYHQKYRLRHRKDLQAALLDLCGSDRAMVDSTAAARINGILAGYGTKTSVAKLDLPESVLRNLP